VAKGHAQQCAHQRTLSVWQLCLQCEPSPHHVETSSPFHFLPTQELTGSEDPVSRNVVSGLCIVVFFGTSLSEYALLNASLTAATDFDAT
jgi:hypothetical protein